MSQANDTCLAPEISDPDVAGFGVRTVTTSIRADSSTLISRQVLLSFAVSISLTVFLILAAYLSHSLPPEYYNAVDEMLLSVLRRRGSPSPRSEAGAARARRILAFESFARVLSDQQLATSFALTGALCAIRFGIGGMDERVSTFSYSIAVVLAYFSCMVHLATLSVLRAYMDRSHSPRNIRMVALTVIVCLLVFLALETLMMVGSFRLTVRCSVALRPLQPPDGVTEWEMAIGTVFFAVFGGYLALGYAHRAIDVLNKPYRRNRTILLAQLLSLLDSSTAFDSERCRLVTARQTFSLGFSMSRRKFGWFYLLVAVHGELARSFFWEIIWILFCYFIGMIQLFLGVYGSAIPLQPTFGQLMPLALLALPILNALDAYFGDCPAKSPTVGICTLIIQPQ